MFNRPNLSHATQKIVGEQGHIYVANDSLPYFCKDHIDCLPKIRILHQNYFEWKRKSVYLDGKHANFRVKHANSKFFQDPTVGSQRFNTLLVGW